MTSYAAGPYACMIFADLGAEVIKVEPPKVGEPFRFFGGGYQAAYFIALNRNKKSLALNLKSTEGQEVMLKLLEESDIFVENLGPGVVDRLGLSYQTVSTRNPQLIYCSIKGYGKGPYEKRPAFDPVVEAESGLMSVMGEPDRSPVRLGGPMIDYVTGTFSVIAVMGALLKRNAYGKGEKIEVNLFESAVSMMTQSLNIYALYKHLPEKLGSGWGPYQVFNASDGFVFVGVSSDKHWERFCDAFKVSREIKERYALRVARDENDAELERLVAKMVANLRVSEVVKRLTNAGVPGAPVNTMKEVLEDPHLQSRKSLISLTPDLEVTHTEDFRVSVNPMLPIRSSYYNPSITNTWIPAQKLGNHSVEILRNLGYSEPQIEDLRKRKIVWPYI
ncbi:MAG: CoA transferase [Candidatus Bathyarchaeota archaeon]|nr:MAG: CoA transferase [Candidatus Bathyarchaeota archaeon]